MGRRGSDKGSQLTLFFAVFAVFFEVFFYAVVVESDGSRNWVKNLSRVPEAIKAIK